LFCCQFNELTLLAINIGPRSSCAMNNKITVPVDTIYDMMQICKNNSIQGSKLASCKIVYTPHANLKKNFEMDSGTVTYHNSKLQRYGRCDKDRPCIKRLEKTKSQDITIDFYEEFQEHQKNMVQRKKQERNRPSVDESDLYDPMLDDLKSIKHKTTRQGDALSGLDHALEELSFAKATTDTIPKHGDDDDDDEDTSLRISTDPIWMQEDKRRRSETDDNVIFLCERGYTLDQAQQALIQHPSKLGALKALFFPPDTTATTDSSGSNDEERQMVRQEEKEVLQAIFGEDDPTVKFQEGDDNLDSVFPITSYEPPGRYELPPPLRMEVYASNTKYPNEAPILAMKGGGLCEALLHRLTRLLQAEALTRATEEPGDPQIFNLLQFVGEQVEELVEEERVELANKEKERRAILAQATKEADAEKALQDGPSKTVFKSDGERRAYAKSILSAGGGLGVGEGMPEESKKEKKHYATGVTDQSLIEDMFG
jgi:hypothetical protein